MKKFWVRDEFETKWILDYIKFIEWKVIEYLTIYNKI